MLIKLFNLPLYHMLFTNKEDRYDNYKTVCIRLNKKRAYFKRVKYMLHVKSDQASGSKFKRHGQFLCDR